MINTICFDLDGTLVKSEMVILKTFDHVFKKMFKDGVDDLINYRKYMGPSLEQTFRLFAKDEDEVKLAVKEYISFYPTIELEYLESYPNISETLDYLKENGYKICLVTNKRLTSTYISMKHYDLNKYFDSYVASERLGEKQKPDKYSIELCCKDLNVKAENIIMIGDNDVDVNCGKNAGCKTALVAYNPWFEVAKKANPDYVLYDMKDLIDILKEENK